ncbi:MAG: DUF1801 domain-containing protein [Planctomycetota bacterium]
MAEPKTQRTTASVEKFLKGVAADRQDDCRKIIDLMQKATGEPPAMWGPSIIGFGSYHYVYASGREGDWPVTGFSPRKKDFSLYIMSGFDRYDELMKKLGRHKTGKSCLYIRKLEDVHLPTLKELVKKSVAHMRKTYR